MFHSFHPSPFETPNSALPEAAALRSSISALRGVCESLLRNEPEALHAARGMLADFSARLSVYLSSEEGDGHFEAIVDECPGLDSRVRRLERTHDALRGSIASACLLARDEENSDGPSLGRHIEQLLDELERHERAQNQLLQDFFLSDAGSSE